MRPTYQTFIVTRGDTSFEEKATSREELDRKLAKHAENFPKAHPVTGIRRGSLVAEWIEEDKKFWQS
jgi:hypothetical protein